MSEYGGFESGGESSYEGSDEGFSGSQGNSSGGINPAWNDVLSAIPEDAHSAVIPHLKNWDQNYSRLQQEHSRFNDYKDFATNGIPAEQLRMGHGLLQAIQQNPKEVYEALAQSFGFGGIEQDETEVPDELAGLPPEVVQKLQRLEQGYELLAKSRIEEEEAKRQAREDAALEQTMSQLKAQHGDFDEVYVLAQMMQGAKPEEAIGAYQSFVEKVLAENNRPKPPRIMSSGGSTIPGEQRIDPRKLDSSQTKNLVADMLKAAAQQNAQ
jgi:hypothetical protein